MFKTIPAFRAFSRHHFKANNNISILSIPFSEFKNTKLSKKIKYAPTVIIVDKGKVITSLNAESDNDLPKYQDVDEFTFSVVS